MLFKDLIGIIEEFGSKKSMDEVMVAAHTNKNWYGLKREIEAIFKDTDLQLPVDQLNSEEKSSIMRKE